MNLWHKLNQAALLAQDAGNEVAGSGTGDSVASMLGRSLMLAIVFSVLGIVVLAVSFIVLTKFLPFSIRKEIEEDQNTALALLLSSIVIGISLIVAASIIG